MVPRAAVIVVCRNHRRRLLATAPGLAQGQPARANCSAKVIEKEVDVDSL
jgi:hypothetical protein